MKSQIMYVELTEGHYHNGPAWIGNALFSKTGKTVYFNGLAFHKTRGLATELVSGKRYWISGVKKNGEDRHWAMESKNRSRVKIDKDAVEEYLQLRKLPDLPKNLFEVVTLNNIPPKEETTRIENELYENKNSNLFQGIVYTSKKEQSK